MPGRFPSTLLLLLILMTNGTGQTSAPPGYLPFAQCPLQVSFNISRIHQMLVRAENTGLQTIAGFDLRVRVPSWQEVSRDNPETVQPRYFRFFSTPVWTNDAQQREWHHIHVRNRIRPGEERYIPVEIYGGGLVNLIHIEFSDGSSMATPFCTNRLVGMQFRP